MGWRSRLLIIGWPLIGMVISMPFLNFKGPIGNIASVVMIVSFLCAFTNTPAMGLAISKRPPAFIEGEPPEHTRRRRMITNLVTLGLSVLIPVLLFGSCLYAFTPPH